MALGRAALDALTGAGGGTGDDAVELPAEADFLPTSPSTST